MNFSSSPNPEEHFDAGAPHGRPGPGGPPGPPRSPSRHRSPPPPPHAPDSWERRWPPAPPAFAYSYPGPFAGPYVAPYAVPVSYYPESIPVAVPVYASNVIRPTQNVPVSCRPLTSVSQICTTAPQLECSPVTNTCSIIPSSQSVMPYGYNATVSLPVRTPQVYDSKRFVLQ